MRKAKPRASKPDRKIAPPSANEMLVWTPRLARIKRRAERSARLATQEMDALLRDLRQDLVDLKKRRKLRANRGKTAACRR